MGMLLKQAISASYSDNFQDCNIKMEQQNSESAIRHDISNDIGMNCRVLPMDADGVSWRCPCVGLRCEKIVFTDILQLTTHLKSDHGLALFYAAL